ncbi:MAG TPA: tripartite tricarboxylate transporter substrate binding protein [Thermodesulfobacteriota bacterium]|nr:tripartite tricarboxylate transporter substrate binding protein [Thermodesulfobacteriota bacterium]
MLRNVAYAFLVIAAGLVPLTSVANAQGYPTKPIEVIVGYPPGGGTDMIARAVSDVAPKYVGQPLVVVNKAGATGTIAAQSVAAAKPDGYMLLVAGGSETISVPHFKKLPYDTLNDFVPVIRLMIERVGFYVKSDSPWKTMQEFMADAKQNPEKYTYATSGIGGLHHATVQVLEKRTGVRLRHVPHKGGAETLAALAGGHVNIAMASPNEAYALLQGGRVRPLANASLVRSPVEPNTPTLKELGYDVYIENQKGFVFPKGTPQPIIQKLHDSVKKVFDDPQFKASAEKLQVELAYLSGDDFRKTMKAMYDQVGESLKK